MSGTNTSQSTNNENNDVLADAWEIYKKNDIVCCGCTETVPGVIGSCFALGCASQHNACVACFGNLTAALGQACQIMCPGCNDKVSSWVPH